MNYTQLDIHHKQELLAHLQMVMLCLTALEAVTGLPLDEWNKQLGEATSRYVNGLSKQEIEDLIQDVENKHDSARSTLRA